VPFFNRVDLPTSAKSDIYCPRFFTYELGRSMGRMLTTQFNSVVDGDIQTFSIRFDQRGGENVLTFIGWTEKNTNTVGDSVQCFHRGEPQFRISIPRDISMTGFHTVTNTICTSFPLSHITTLCLGEALLRVPTPLWKAAFCGLKYVEELHVGSLDSIPLFGALVGNLVDETISGGHAEITPLFPRLSTLMIKNVRLKARTLLQHSTNDFLGRLEDVLKWRHEHGWKVQRLHMVVEGHISPKDVETLKPFVGELILDRKSEIPAGLRISLSHLTADD